MDLQSEQLDNLLVVSLYFREIVGVDDVVKGFNLLLCLRLQGLDLLSEGLIVALHGLV